MTIGNTPLVKGAGLLDGTSDIAYTDCSAGLTYEHTYEYANDRQKRAFTTAELSNLGTFKLAGAKQYIDLATATTKNLCGLNNGEGLRDAFFYLHGCSLVERYNLRAKFKP
jgi:hypothetical protein